jgi:hypothetical protein
VLPVETILSGEGVFRGGLDAITFDTSGGWSEDGRKALKNVVMGD